MKKYLLLLLLFKSFWGYSQTKATVTEKPVDGARTVTFVNPAPIEIDGILEAIPTTKDGKADGVLNVSFKGGTGNYTYRWTKDSGPFNPTSWSTLGAGKYTITPIDGNLCESQEAFPFEIFQPKKLEVTIKEPSIIDCPGGKGTLNTEAAGGYPYQTNVARKYTYIWYKCDEYGANKSEITGEIDSELSNREAGFYMVIVSDSKNLSDPFIRELKQNSKITATEKISPVLCKGGTGTISLTISGGTPPYTINWTGDNIATASINTDGTVLTAKAGTFYYTITDSKQCQFSKNPIAAELIDPEVIKINIISQTTPTSVNTLDGTLNFSVTGGEGGYNYFLKKENEAEVTYTSTSITNLNGTYRLRVSDKNGCSVEYPTTIAIEPLIVKEALHVNILCKGESSSTGRITVTANGGTLYTNENYTYQWYECSTVNGTYTKISGEINPAIKDLSAGFYKVRIGDSVTVLSDNSGIWSESFEITEPQNQLSITSSVGQQQNVSCYGGSNGAIAINVSGGTAGYTYEWNDGSEDKDRTGLTKGNYSVTVTDANGCFKKLSNIVISEPAEAIKILTPTIKNVDINGQSTGSITFSSDPTGGNGGYTYQWTSETITGFSADTRDLTGIQAGIYKLKVLDNKSCESIPYTFTVLEKNKLEVTIKESAFIKCNGDSNGKLTAEVTGGVAPYKYIWKKNGITLSGENSATLSGLDFGEYSVFVTDSANPEPGPFASAQQLNFKLRQPDVLKVSLAKQTNVLCFGAATGAIEITIEGGTAPYTQQWIKDGANYTGNVNQLEKGEYNVIVTDAVGHGCTATLDKPVIITQPAAPLKIESANVTNLTGFETMNGNITVSVSGGKPNYKYEWRKDSEQNPFSTASSISALPIGTYHLIVTDANNCTLPQVDYTITQPDRLEITSLIQTAGTSIQCYSGSTAEYKATVTGGVKPYTFEWLNTTTGVKYNSIQTVDNINPKITISKASNLAAGNYTISIKDDKNNILFGTDTFTIVQPEKLAFTYTKENVSCFTGSNGSIKLSITGGTKDTDITKPYTIISAGTVDNQNGIVSGLTAGSYVVKVIDKNGCQTDQQTIEITEPQVSVYIANSMVTPATGFGLSTGKIGITVAGGTIGYTYEWKNNSGTVVGTDSPNLVNVIAGTYSVLVKDASGCTTTNIYTIEEPTKPILTETHLQSRCNGLLGSLDATATGGATYNQNQSDRTYTYRLKNKTSGVTTTKIGNTARFTNIADGNYSLTATDISGVDSNAIDVQFKQPTPIVVSLVSKSNVNCFGDQDGVIAISVSGGTPLLVNGNPKYTYQWKKKNAVTHNYENFIPTSLSTLYAGMYAVEVRDNNYDSGDGIHCIGILENIEITQPDDFGFDIDKIKYTDPSGSGNDGKLHFEITGGIPNYEYKFYKKDINGNEILITPNVTSSLKTIDFTGLVKDHYYISAKDATGCTKYADFDFRDNPLTVNVIQTQNISCNGANNAILKVNAIGGYGQKKISWYRNNALLINEIKENLLNVQPGTYYAVVKDTKKVEVTSNVITVTEPQKVLFSTIQEPVKCFGDNNGQVTLTASGGNGNFRYRYSSNNILIKDWENFSNASTTVITGLSAGDYSIEVEDFLQCQSTKASVKIISPNALTVNNTISIPAKGKGLSNGSLTITVQGGNGDYTYKWFKSDHTGISQNTSTATNLSAGKYYVVISDSKGCSLTSALLEVTEPLLLETNIAVQNIILCNGDKNGSLKPTTTGGFLKPGDNYTYEWYEAGNASVLATTPILNSVGIGSYYVIATDSNGNEAKSQILAVAQPAVLNATLTSDYTLCGDGSDWTVTATTSGGTLPYTFIWNTGAKTASLQNVPPANYSVLITDRNGCTITKNITITAPIHLATVETIKMPTCYGGSDATIELNSYGGKAPYTYLWNTGEESNILRNASAGVYVVSVTDSKGCVITHDYTIENPPKDIINLGQDVTLCLDQTLTINAAINDDKATYLWKSDKGFSSNKAMITVSEPADYTVIVTNKLGCEATDTIRISSQNTAISAEFAVSSQVFKNEKIVIVDISNPEADEIEWILPAKAKVITKNKDYAEISFSEVGEYEITLNTKKGDCTAFQTKQILVTEGEYEEEDPDETDAQTKFDLKIYPNPSQGIFTVDVTLDKVMPAHVKVYNLTNNLLIDSKTEDGKDNYLFNFSLSGLPSGLYFVLFESKQGSKLRKIIIQ